MKKLLLLLSLIGTLALPGLVRADLVLHYTFEEGTGSTTADLASVQAGDNAGTLLGGANFRNEPTRQPIALAVPTYFGC